MLSSFKTIEVLIQLSNVYLEISNVSVQFPRTQKL